MTEFETRYNNVQVSDVLEGKDPAVTKAIKDVLSTLNEDIESKSKLILNFAILPLDFSIKGGELGKYQALLGSKLIQILVSIHPW